MSIQEEILAFWLEEVGPSGWYASDPKLDEKIRSKFLETWQDVQKKSCAGWAISPRGTLALLILLDQFPRNMFRNDGTAFSTDKQARAKAKKALELGWDLKIDTPERQFFYLPLMHSECLGDQERAVRLIRERMASDSQLLHAKAHREVIRKYGRFPHRNVDLGRKTSAEEQQYLDSGAYGGVVKRLQAAV